MPNSLLKKTLFGKMGATAGLSSSVFSEDRCTAGQASSGTRVFQHSAIGHPLACLAILFASSGAAGAAAAEWPQFRGPSGQGHAGQGHAGQGHAAANGVPLQWSETENIVWKTPVDGRGWSSPVISGNQIWLTTSIDDGRSLRAVCMARDDGRLLHDVEVFDKDEPGAIHAKNSHASPTPVLDEDRVYVHFGAHGTACLTSDGEVLWRNDDMEYNHRHGPAGSPVVYEDLLIFSCDGTDVQFVVALDKRNGQIRWKTNRQGPMAYSTPLVIRSDGIDQLISPGGDQVVSYNPRTGEAIWRCRYDGYSVIPRPVYSEGLVYLSSGFNDPVLYAIRTDGRGDVTETHVAWTLDKNAPLSPSPLLVDGLLYLVSDGGVATCRDALTGKQHWRHRLGGGYSASPLLAGGRIYFQSEAGVTTVIAPGTEYQELATNTLDGRTLASPAPVGQAIFLRTESHLYRIEASGDKAPQ